MIGALHEQVTGRRGDIPCNSSRVAAARGVRQRRRSGERGSKPFPAAELYLYEWHLRHALELFMCKIRAESEHREVINGLL